MSEDNNVIDVEFGESTSEEEDTQPYIVMPFTAVNTQGFIIEQQVSLTIDMAEGVYAALGQALQDHYVTQGKEN